MYSSSFIPRPDKNSLLAAFKGKKVELLPTPSLIIDRNIFAANCEKMLANAAAMGADFRPHIKTHKTVEGTELQLGSGSLKTDKIVVSTMAEAWGVLPLVEKYIINDIHFSLPVLKSRLGELADLAGMVPHVRLMLDNAEQLNVLAQYSKTHGLSNKWSVFLKIDMGTKRAGLANGSDSLKETIAKFTSGDVAPYVELYGFYCHAGHSYSANGIALAKDLLLEEIAHANRAAEYAIGVNPAWGGNLTISVGATPTAHSSSITTAHDIDQSVGKLAGKLELHAGCYPCCDLQQVSTGLVSLGDVSITVLAEVVSTYPGRGEKGPGEQLVNAGVLALAREFSAVPGHGVVVSPSGFENWSVGRLSQEHGILVPLEDKPTEFLPLGTVVRIVPQHACIAAAQYPFLFAVEDGIVVDVWITYKNW